MHVDRKVVDPNEEVWVSEGYLKNVWALLGGDINCSLKEKLEPNLSLGHAGDLPLEEDLRRVLVQVRDNFELEHREDCSVDLDESLFQHLTDIQNLLHVLVEYDYNFTS